MKYHIEIEADTQPGLIEAIEEVRSAFASGSSWRNVSSGSFRLKLKPEDERTQEELQQQWKDAHPRPSAPWKE